MLIAGPSMSGKSTIASNIIKNFFDTTTFDRNKLDVIIVSPSKFDIAQTEKVNVSIFKSFTKALESLKDDSLIVIDDMIFELSNNEKLAGLFTKESHHRNISVILLSQNVFFKSAVFRVVSLNCKYILLTKTVRDLTQIEMLGRQLFPRKQKLFLEIFLMATSEPYGYLLVDLTQSTDDQFRLRSKAIYGESIKDCIAPIIYKFRHV